MNEVYFIAHKTYKVQSMSPKVKSIKGGVATSSHLDLDPNMNPPFVWTQLP